MQACLQTRSAEVEGCGRGEEEAKGGACATQTTYLARQCASPEITEGQLEPLVGAVDIDLEGDKSVWIGGRGCGHGR